MREVQLGALVEAAVASEAGWVQLWNTIEPQVWALVDRPRFASHLAHTEPARQRIVGAIYARLSADRCHLLQRYLDAQHTSRGVRFGRWLRTTAKRIAMSYARYDAPPAAVRRRSARRIG